MILHGGTRKSPISRGFNSVWDVGANAFACPFPSVPPHPGPIALALGDPLRPDASSMVC